MFQCVNHTSDHLTIRVWNISVVCFRRSEIESHQRLKGRMISHYLTPGLFGSNLVTFAEIDLEFFAPQ